MQTARPREERVHLIDYDEGGIAQHASRIGGAPHKHRLDRFRRDERDAFGALRGRDSCRTGRVAVPFDDTDIHPLAKLFEPLELVVDQRLKRADVENREAASRVGLPQR